MNKQALNSTQRFSVNSSLSSLRNWEHLYQPNLSNKNQQNKRFSYQDAHNNIASNQKENMRNNFAQSSTNNCLNHSNKQAQYIALEASNEPMYLCQRCAILVASKGFQIKKMQEKRATRVEIKELDIRKQISSSFNSIKQHREQTLQKIQTLQSSLQKQESVLDDYFLSLQRYLQAEKQYFCKQIMKSKKQVQSMKNESNKYYLNLLQKVKSLSQQNLYASKDIPAQLTYYLQEISKANYKINPQKAQINYKLKPLQLLAQQLHNLIHFKEQKAAKQFLNVVGKNEKQSSPTRSLQLSFQQENNGTDKQSSRNRKQNVIITNILSSIDMF